MLKTARDQIRSFIALAAIAAAGIFSLFSGDLETSLALAGSPLLFAQIRKVDEEKRLVFGRIAEEQVDKADEIMDYMSSKPHFEKWSADIAADTGGKNLGNVRAMHGKVAAGGLTAITYDDAGKTIDVCAKVVDDNEWKKVLAGVYTGFSIGGSYVGEKKVEKMNDGKQATRYTAKPSEVSLVDRPCMKGAKFFEVQKADGSLAKVDFVEVAADDLEVNGTAEDLAAFAKVLNSEGMSIADLNKALPAWLAAKKKGADAEPTDDDKAKAAKEAKDKADAEKADAAGKLAKADDAAIDAGLGAVEKALTDAKPALAKIGARNNAADKARLAKIHEQVVELGHECAPAAKADAAAQLAKVADARAKLMKGVSDPEHLKGKTDDEILKLADALDKVVPPGDLAKMVADAVAPLQKVIDSQAARLVKLEEQPAPAKISLRVVTKGEDMQDDGPDADDKALAEKFAPIVDSGGGKHEVAGLIKGLHAVGGAPMRLPTSMRGR